MQLEMHIDSKRCVEEQILNKFAKEHPEMVKKAMDAI